MACKSTLPYLYDGLSSGAKRYDACLETDVGHCSYVEVSIALTDPRLRMCEHLGCAANVAEWHFAKSRCNAKFDRNRGKADMAGPAVGSTWSRVTLNGYLIGTRSVTEMCSKMATRFSIRSRSGRISCRPNKLILVMSSTVYC
jgi:hypothetical protein